MPLISWKPEFDTGVEAIDEQHRGLVDLINAFAEANAQGRGSRMMNRTLNDLIGYTQEHFQFEEDYMAGIGYAKLDQHRALHRRLVQKIERFQYEFIHGGRQITEEISAFLQDWLTTHILKCDLDFAAGPPDDGAGDGRDGTATSDAAATTADSAVPTHVEN